MNLTAEVIVGDNRETLKQLSDKSVQTVVTSPPYWGLRDYGEDEQIGLEGSPQDFVEQLCLVFDEIWRVLKDDGTIWVNLGDSYSAMRDSKAVPDTLREGDGTRVAKAANRNPANLRAAGLKHKDLVGIPWRFAFAMQDRGWYLRQDIIWAKPNPMPESVTDRCTKSHEYIFLLTKSAKYFYDHDAIKEDATTEPTVRDRSKENYQQSFSGGRFSEGARQFGSDDMKKNKRSVWTIATKPYKDAHFATYPPELITPCIVAGSKENDIVLDPFSGSGTTGEVALLHNRNYIGLELNPEYAKLSEKRLLEAGGMFASVSVR